MKDKIAEIWDKRNGRNGDPYKQYVLNPTFLKLSGKLTNLTVLDQGCGNGHLSLKIAKQKPNKIILLDFFEGNLNFARKYLKKINLQLL